MNTVTRNKLRVVFIGQNGPFTIQPLRAVADSHSVVGIVESAPRGWTPIVETPSRNPVRRNLGRLRRRLFPPTPYKSALQALSDGSSTSFFFLNRFNRDALNEFVQGLRPDVICVASMSQLLHESTYSLAPLGAINLHPSPLPKYRGPNPWFWQYYNVEPRSAMTVHAVDSGEDTGDILAQQPFEIALGERFATVFERAIALGARVMSTALDDLANGRAVRVPQTEASPSPRARNVKRNEPLIDWVGWPIERVWHVMRGTGDWFDAIEPPGGAESGLRWQVGEISRRPGHLPPGTRAKDREGYYVAHRDGRIRLTVDAAAGTRMRYYRFVAAGT